MFSTDEIKDRIRKLLNVAANDASTEGEIDNAMRFAKNLMDKHHLAEEDLATEPEDQYKAARNAPKTRYYATVGTRLYTWEQHLAMFVSDFVSVGVYIDPNPRQARRVNGFAIWDEQGNTFDGKSFVFYGIDEDAMMATEIYHSLHATIRTMGFLKFGGCYKGNGGSYCQGFVNGLAERIKKEKAQERLAAPTGTAMILIDRRNDLVAYKQQIGKAWLEQKLGWKLRKGQRSSGASGSREAFSEGQSDGRRAEVSNTKTQKLTAG